MRHIKLTPHAGGKFVVNAPGSGLPPRTYGSLDKALARVRELAA